MPQRRLLTTVSPLPLSGNSDVQRSVYARTTFGVCTYGGRCTHVRRSVYTRATVGVRHRWNGKRRRDGHGGDGIKVLTDRKNHKTVG